MGLDMYLYRMARYKDATPDDVSKIESYLRWNKDKKNPRLAAKNYTCKEWCGVDEEDLPPASYINFYRQYYKTSYSDWDTEHKYGYDSIKEMVGYWRKANAVHNWFVENVQDDVDDCKYHREVTKDDLRELYDICHEIVCNSTLIPTENGMRIEDPSTAERLLPSCSGFFFGGTEYDEYYLHDVRKTMEIIEKVVRTTDFRTQMIYYVSSW